MKKVQLQKVQRDVMLLEAQGKKMREYQNIRSNELVEVDELKEGIKKEKMDAQQKKKRERDAAELVIKANVIEKQRVLGEQEKEKQNQIKLQEQYMAMLDKKDQQRADEKAARELRI